MKHGAKLNTLGRSRNERNALIMSLVRELVLRDVITTTEAKAKALRPAVEKLITKAKVDTLSSRRLIASRVNNDEEVVAKLFTVLAPKYKDRAGGYTRIVKMGQRGMDARSVAKIAFV